MSDNSVTTVRRKNRVCYYLVWQLCVVWIKRKEHNNAVLVRQLFSRPNFPTQVAGRFRFERPWNAKRRVVVICRQAGETRWWIQPGGLRERKMSRSRIWQLSHASLTQASTGTIFDQIWDAHSFPSDAGEWTSEKMFWSSLAFAPWKYTIILQKL